MRNLLYSLRLYDVIRQKIVVNIIFSLLLILITFSIKDSDRESQSVKTANISNTSAHPQLIDAYGKLPLSFEANCGQADPSVKFLSRGLGYNLYLRSDEAVLALSKSHNLSGADRLFPRTEDDKSSDKSQSHPDILRLRLVDANPAPQIVGMEKLPGKINYFISNDPNEWHTDVPTFGKVKYEAVYSGVDLVYYGNQNQIEYDLIIAPGINPEAIKLNVEGAKELMIDDAGNLVMQTDAENLILKKPQIYQEIEGQKQPITGQYTTAAGDYNIGFQVGHYDNSRPLVIDPVLVYSTYLGSEWESAGRAIAVDAHGCAYVTGRTSSSSFPVTPGAFQNTRGTNNTPTNNDYEAFVTKLNADGTALVYSTYLGGSDYDEEALGIAVDAEGCAYVTGISWSDNFPTTPGAFQPTSHDPGRNDWFNGEAFVTKLNPTGSALVYSTYLGGGDEGRADYGTAIAVDVDGNAYITGLTSCTDFPITSHAFKTTFNGWGDAFVTKLSADGSSLIYSTFLGGYEAWASGIAVDAVGNAYITGETFGAFPTTPGALQTNGRCFVTKLNTSGSNLIYSTRLPGQSPRGVAVDDVGCAYITGLTTTFDNYTATDGAYQTTHGGGYTDAFVMKLNSTASALLYSTFLGGNSRDRGTGIAIDMNGRAYVVGVTESDNFPVKSAVQENYGTQRDAFVALIDPSQTGEASLIYATYLGGSGSEYDDGVNPATASTNTYRPVVYDDYGGKWTGGIALDKNGNAFVTGRTSSNDFPTTEGAFDRLGQGEAFVVKIGEAKAKDEVGVWQEIKLSSSGAFSADPDSNVVTFDDYEAEVVMAGEDTLYVLCPYELVENRDRTDAIPDTAKREVTVVVKVIEATGDSSKVLETGVIFVPPKLLIHDEVTRAEPPVRQEVLWQEGWAGTRAFLFFGHATDGMAAVRVTNTSIQFPPPLSLLAKVITPSGSYDASPYLSYGNMPNVGIQNAGIQFPIDKDGWCIILVAAGPLRGVTPELPLSPGPFPAQLQIHLAGNVGLPMMSGRDIWPRGTRLDTYFNHPAPRPENLQNAALVGGQYAETGLFKFANPVSTSQYAIAVLVPPAGFPLGYPIWPVSIAPVRARPPVAIVDPTVPEAPTPDAANPLRGVVIDLAQVPIPASPLIPVPPQGVARIPGSPDGSGVTLPMGDITSLIVDMGSGNEIVNGNGPDFRVIALSGSYQVAVSNTPFADTFIPMSTGTGQADFDIAGTGLTSVRYVRILVSTGTATIDAVQSLHFFADEIHPTIGPLSDVGYATITARRQKSPLTPLDPLLELIGPDGSFLGKDESGLGDDTDPDRSDAALIRMDLNMEGFYRFLGRGYDTQPDNQSFGRLFTRLETAGKYDPVELKISSLNESQAVAQKTGIISEPRQRDSYLFQAAPGTTISIVVNGIGNSPLPDPLIELYDPEDFFIAANDNFDIPQRGRNSALTVTLDPTGRFPNPSTYRIVVMGIDGESPPPVAVENGTAHTRRVNGGNYELKVFTGAMTVRPAVVSVSPNKAVQGTTNLEVTLNGNNFANGATVTFSGTGITVETANFINPGQLKATVDIAPTASTGFRDVIVSNPDGQSGTGSGVFEVRASLGRAVLNWDAPVSGGVAPPTNLIAQYSGDGLAAGTGSAGPGKRYVLPGVERKQPSRSTKGEPSSAIVLTQTDEVEPNNYSDEAQALTGNSPLVVNGNAEVDDFGGIIFTGFYRSETDDIEDLFLVTTTAPGLKVNLTGFTSDCDLYLMPAASMFQITGSATIGTSVAEEINQPDWAADAYLVGVSIFDPAPLGASATPYVLTLTGQFQEGGTANLQSYRIYRSTSADARNSGVQVGEVDAGTQIFTDPLPHTGDFFYQVTAVYDQGESVPSNEATILVTKVEDGQPVNIPINFELSQNYPNPFNPITTICYAIPKPCFVDLKVYNLLGEEIATLVQETKPAGEYKLLWDASGLPSGLYLYRIQMGDFIQTKKAVLLK